MANSEFDLVGLFRSHLEYNSEAGQFRWKVSHKRGGSKSTGWFTVHRKSSGRFDIQIRRKRYEAKRVAWAIHYGVMPVGEVRLVSGESIAIENLYDFGMQEIGKRDFSREQLSKFLEYSHEEGSFRWKIRVSSHCAESWFIPTDHGKGAGSIDIFGSRYVCTHLAWFLYWGVWPENEVDHINGNDQDHRMENLRDVPHADNMKNLSMNKNNKTGHNGIVKVGSGNFTASISVKGKQKIIGTFVNIDDAVKARKSEEARYGFHENHGRKR